MPPNLSGCTVGTGPFAKEYFQWLRRDRGTPPHRRIVHRSGVTVGADGHPSTILFDELKGRQGATLCVGRPNLTLRHPTIRGCRHSTFALTERGRSRRWVADERAVPQGQAARSSVSRHGPLSNIHASRGEQGGTRIRSALDAVPTREPSPKGRLRAARRREPTFVFGPAGRSDDARERGEGACLGPRSCPRVFAAVASTAPQHGVPSATVRRSPGPGQAARPGVTGGPISLAGTSIRARFRNRVRLWII